MVDPTTSIRRAAALLDESSALAHEAVRPGFLRQLVDRGGRARSLERAISQAERAAIELEASGARGSDAAAGVRELTTELRRRLSLDSFSVVRHDYPIDLSPEWLAIHRDRARLLEQVADLDDVAARARIGQLFDDHARTALEQPKDQPTRAALAVLAGMPASLRPELLRDRFKPNLWEIVGAVREGGRSMTADDMLVELRAVLDRRALASAPGTTPASLRAELDALLALPNSKLGDAELRRISLIAGMPDELRPAILDVAPAAPSHALVDVAGDRFAEYGKRMLHANVDAVRVASEVEAMAKAGTLPTREAAIGEIAAILDLPNDVITAAQLRRMSVLARLPEHVRPALPPRSTRIAFEDAGLVEWATLDREIDVGRTLDDARTFFHVLRSPEEAARTLRASFDSGEVFDLRRLSALQQYPALLADAGITRDMLADQLAAQLARAGDVDVRGGGLRWALDETRTRLMARNLDAEFEPLRAQALELLDRNVARIDGVRTDTFGKHPDYAEVGRLASITHLLGEVEKRAAPAAANAETLAW